MEYPTWTNDDIFTWHGGCKLNIFLHHSYITSGYGTGNEYITACLDMFASVALLQLTVFSQASDNIIIYDKHEDKDWEQEWPEFPEGDYRSCNLLLGTLYTEDGMDPGNGRVFGTSGMSVINSMFCQLFHERDLGTLLLMRFHEKLWCRINSYRKITKALGYGIWRYIVDYYLEDKYKYSFYGHFPNHKQYHLPFSYREVQSTFGRTKELCLLNTSGSVIDHTGNLKKVIYDLVN